MELTCKSVDQSTFVQTDTIDASESGSLAECHCRLALLLVAHIDITLELFKAGVA